MSDHLGNYLTVPHDMFQRWAEVALEGSMAFDAFHMDDDDDSSGDEAQRAAAHDMYMVNQMAAALATVRPLMVAAAVRVPLDLLYQWFAFWRDHEFMPAKMPNSLHTETASLLTVANQMHGTAYDVRAGAGFTAGDPVWFVDPFDDSLRAGHVSAVYPGNTYDVRWIDDLGGVAHVPAASLRSRDAAQQGS